MYLSVVLSIILYYLCAPGTDALSINYTTKYIDVPLDHFDFGNNGTFKLRYLVNSTHWANDGPIFFYTGNEGDVEVFAENTGFMWEIAPAFNALIVFAEHRYYGKSLPFGNNSFNDPKRTGYLSSSQALADYVLLIDYLQSAKENDVWHGKGFGRHPVIAFGGSYGGMLAAWIRMKYPYAVAGAIAASAPIFQFPELTKCEAFNRIISSTFKVASINDCTIPIRNSWSEIRELAKTDAGKEWLTSAWQLCTPMKTADDIKALIDWLEDVYGNIAMANYPYPANFLAPMPAHPVKAICDRLQNSTLKGKPLIKSLIYALSIYTNYTGQTKCINTNQSIQTGVDELGWSYQACTEMVMPMCTDGINDMYEPAPWNFTAYSEDCYKQWKVRPQAKYAELRYGGRNIGAFSNIVFSNGLLDPWTSGGVLRNISDTLWAVLIPEGAHHLDLRASNRHDPESVRMARKLHQHAIQTWLRDFYD